MKFSDFKYRTSDEEVMDDFYLEGEELREILKDLDKVNKWLGGNRISIEGIRKILKGMPLSPIKILDVGCGNGSMLREVAEYGRKNDLRFELVGIDANESAIKIARELAKNYPEISFLPMNIFSENFENMEADIILCTLTLHHFKEKEIEQLVKLFLSNSRMGVVINDLERSPVAYHLFQLFCVAFINNEVARKDGLTSIRRGFKMQDLKKYGQEISAVQEIKWKWAFRYQWILYKNKKH